MLDFSLSDEQRIFRDSVRSFIDKEIIPLETQVLRNEREGRPGLERGQLRDLQLKAKSAGLWGFTTPKEYGGAGLGAIMNSLACIERGRTFVPFRFGGYGDNILFSGTDSQKQQYLIPTINGERASCFAITESGAGSDASAIRTRAVRDGDHWIINGEKTFISGGNEADFVIVFAVTDPSRGGSGGITCFLVDRGMGWRSQPIATMGEASLASLVFEDVRVPSSNIVGELGWGFQLAMKWISSGLYEVPSLLVGSSERLLEMAIQHSKKRVSMGHPIAQYQAVQWQIADSHVEIEAVKYLTLLAAWQVDSGHDARHTSSIAKLMGSITADKVVDRVMQIHGGIGYTKELPIERWYRELRMYRIQDGTDEIQRRTIARNLFKGHARLGGIGV
ncbi:alkylation response protein AidB-like acyl-CoA dehydrogenase [Bradyrhizobium sp. cir1]|uniref:acyl-CoA dehydrogenase family protein n=1 Tax=Bradyrhizobium sp. cir1 TaxID=1445730 RepID=UPI001606CE6F|nr:acyl-CoA dehydrogenase family protein [Bradyrhizobium sp. cir1]MBB4374395.1 alkylation response protein AidB-like acyl-CoA dehydrogenase [Bradyrhizobium sp. cir1]